MKPEDIISEIRQQRDTVERGCRRIYELSQVLYAKTRRDRVLQEREAGTDENARERLAQEYRLYIAYSNAWSRFAGMVDQGLKRTSSLDRIMVRTAGEKLQEAERIADLTRKEQARLDREARRQTQQSVPWPSPTVEDLVSLYGEEVMTDAS
jgi:hypothetical protein